jgi:aminopeptidase C
MEANEAHELIEDHEHAAHDESLRPIAFAMSILAVLVAITTLFGHRASTESVLAQASASDQWNEYQAKRIRQNDATLTVGLLSALPLANQSTVANLKAQYQKNIDQWASELDQEAGQARNFEAEVRLAKRKGDRFDLGEALLEIGLVITSIALLTRQRVYSMLGSALGAAGVVAAAMAFLLH